MQRGQARAVERRLFVEGQRVDTTQLSLGWNECLGRFRKRQFAGAVLRDDFPHRHGAQKHFVAGIRDRPPGGGRQGRAAARQPQEGTSIEEELHAEY